MKKKVKYSDYLCIMDEELKALIDKFAKENNLEFNPQGKLLLEKFAILLDSRKQ